MRFALPLLIAACAAAADASDLQARLASSYAKEAAGDLAGARAVLDGQARDYLVCLRQGWLSYRLGQHPAAATHYQAACTAAPQAVEPRLGLMLPLMAQQRWAEVEKEARQVLRQETGNASASRWLAEALLAQSKPREAAEVADRIYERYPADANLCELAARARAASGSSPQARAAYQALLLLDTRNRAALEWLARNP